LCRRAAFGFGHLDHDVDERLGLWREVALLPCAGWGAWEARILRPLIARVLPGEQAAGQGRPDRDADPVAAGHRHQLAFHPSIDERVWRLVDDHPCQV
jgi:hypothetical protein